jgi:hypothetical protein
MLRLNWQHFAKKIMANEFTELVRLAGKSRWCTSLYCTTCGNGEFRSRLAALDNGFGGRLSNLLSELDLNEYTTLGDWLDCLRLAFIHLPFAPQRDAALKNWLPYARTNVRFADGVLFYIIRYVSGEIRESWIASCVDLAIESKDTSLIESLVWVVHSDLTRYPDLVDVAHNLAATSAKVRTALAKTGNLQST